MMLGGSVSLSLLDSLYRIEEISVAFFSSPSTAVDGTTFPPTAVDGLETTLISYRITNQLG